MKKLVCLLMFGLLLSCPSDDGIRIDSLRIINSTDSNIYFYLRGLEPILNSVSPNENFLIIANNNYVLNDEFRGFLSNGSKLFVWLFDEEVVNSIPWEEVVENDMYLVRYDLTLQDLEAMNWVIDYTGE